MGIALLLLAGASGGWALGLHYIEPESEPPAVSFTRFAINAHELYASDMRHPVEFGADQQEPLLLWLSERLGDAVQAPHLQTSASSWSAAACCPRLVSQLRS